MPLVGLARSALRALSLALVFASVSSASALARPPRIPIDAPRTAPIEPVRNAAAYSIPPSFRETLQRIGGARAVRVAQGVPAGKYIALRPMFWVTRDQRGAMFALGGLF